MSWRTRVGALLYDFPRYVLALWPGRWIYMRNRRENVTTDGRGVRCEWQFSSDLHIAKVFPSTGARMLRDAFTQWPVSLRDRPPQPASVPEVAFVIGHRGTERLPHLLATLRNVSGQSGVSIECIVVEQDTEPRIRDLMPDWVHYIFTECQTPYNRAATFNAGAAVAVAPVLILHDNDMIVPAGYAAECARVIRDGYRFIEIKRFTFYLAEAASRLILDGGNVPDAVPTAVVQNLLGGTIAARRDSYFDIGGFDDEFVGWGGEDNEFWDRAASTGSAYRFGYMPVLHLHHAPQVGKLDLTAAGARRYNDVKTIPPRARVEALRNRACGARTEERHPRNGRGE